MKKSPKWPKTWSVFRFGHGKLGDSVFAFESNARKAEEAFKDLPIQLQKEFIKDYIIKPYPKRLYPIGQTVLSFEIPGLKHENKYLVELNENFNGVYFSYSPLIDTPEYLRKFAPASIMKQLSKQVIAIFAELKLRPKSIIIEIKDSSSLGYHGYGARAITSKSGVVYFQLDLSSCPIRDIDFWTGMLWHESMHVKYVLEKRFPSMWPFYIPNAAPLWILDDIIHFSLDGWLERNGKPLMQYSTDDPRVSDLKSFRLSQLRDDLKDNDYKVSERTIKGMANDLWGRETDIREIYQNMLTLGVDIPGNTPLGKYLKRSIIKK